MKKGLVTSVAILMLLCLVACGNGKVNPEDGYVVKGYAKGTLEEVEQVKTTLNPLNVYENLTYTPQMFYGTYRIEGGEEAENIYAGDKQYFDYTVDGNTSQITRVPYKIEAGKNTLSHDLNNVKEYNWMKVYLYEKIGEGDYAPISYECAYEIDENKLILTPLKNYDVDKVNNKITYEFSDAVWEYEFVFEGRNLTLISDENRVTLTAGLDREGEELSLYVHNYLSKDSEALDGIEHISLQYKDTTDNRLYIESVNSEPVYTAVGKVEENGLITLTIPWKSGTQTHQYVYFLCEKDGIILTDGTNTYYYNDSQRDRKANELDTFLTEDQTMILDDLTEQELEDIVEKKEDLIGDLANAFTDAGITVTIDEATGELAMDSSILFGGDSAELTPEGKEFLNKFVEVYTSIIFSEKYDGFISKTMIEGHTAPVSGSTYESGLPLSEERANNVKEYCVSSETGVDTTKLSSSLEAVGYSNSKPVYGANGEVDIAASRRVSFKFIINLDK